MNHQLKSPEKKRKRSQISKHKIFVPIHKAQNYDISLTSDPISYKLWVENGDFFATLDESRHALFSLLERSERGCVDKSYLIKSLWNMGKKGDDVVCYRSSSTNVMQKLKKTLRKFGSVEDKLKLISDIMYVWISQTSPITTQIAVDNLDAWIKISKPLKNDDKSVNKKLWFTKIGLDYFSKSNPLNWVFILNQEEKNNLCEEDDEEEENENTKNNTNVDNNNLSIEISIIFDTRR